MKLLKGYLLCLAIFFTIEQLLLAMTYSVHFRFSEYLLQPLSAVFLLSVLLASAELFPDADIEKIFDTAVAKFPRVLKGSFVFAITAYLSFFVPFFIQTRVSGLGILYLASAYLAIRLSVLPVAFYSATPVKKAWRISGIIFWKLVAFYSTLLLFRDSFLLMPIAIAGVIVIWQVYCRVDKDLEAL